MQLNADMKHPVVVDSSQTPAIMDFQQPEIKRPLSSNGLRPALSQFRAALPFQDCANGSFEARPFHSPLTPPEGSSQAGQLALVQGAGFAFPDGGFVEPPLPDTPPSFHTGRSAADIHYQNFNGSSQWQVIQ